jgi:hypothetical protein
LTRIRSFYFCHLLRCARGNEVSTCRTALRAQVDDPVGSFDQVKVVLDDDHTIARLHQALEQDQQAGGIGRVKPRSRFVQQVEDAP